jgi:predicted neuraminidase
MTRAHPFVLDRERLILPLYHDGFSFSLMAISDDWGKTWHTSTPLVGGGNIQPSIALRRDGSLYTLMRDNGPPPGRLMQADSKDRGETWGPVTDSELLNPGSGSEIITLRNGDWMVIGNDTERGRHSLVIWLSVDEGRHWKWKRAIEHRGEGEGSFHYPSVIEAADGTFHASYSQFLRHEGREAKTIVHAHFNREWVVQGAP